MARKVFIIAFFVAACGFIFAVVDFSSIGKGTTVSQKEVERRIENEIPIGSTKDQVISFLDNLNINGLKPQHSGYIPQEPEGPIVSADRHYVLKGYVSAVIKKSGYDHWRFQVYSIYMDFYFGPDERLMNYKLKTLGDW